MRDASKQGKAGRDAARSLLQTTELADWYGLVNYKHIAGRNFSISLLELGRCLDNVSTPW